MNVTEAIRLNGTSNAGFAAGSSAAFNLRGGKYGVTWNGTGTGSAGLQKLGADGTTYVPVYTAVTATSAYTVIDLPTGTYKFVSATFTAGFAEILRIVS